MTLNGVMAVILCYSAECVSLYCNLRQMAEARQKSVPDNLVFCNV